jgi:hypothetical protein
MKARTSSSPGRTHQRKEHTAELSPRCLERAIRTTILDPIGATSSASWNESIGKDLTDAGTLYEPGHDGNSLNNPWWGRPTGADRAAAWVWFPRCPNPMVKLLRRMPRSQTWFIADAHIQPHHGSPVRGGTRFQWAHGRNAQVTDDGTAWRGCGGEVRREGAYMLQEPESGWELHNRDIPGESVPSRAPIAGLLTDLSRRAPAACTTYQRNWVTEETEVVGFVSRNHGHGIGFS